MHTELRARVRRQQLEERNRKLDEAIAVAAGIVVDSRPESYCESEDDEPEEKNVRRPVRSEKVPMEILKDCIEEEERFHLSLSPEHNLNLPEGSPATPIDATKYDVGWLIDAIRGCTPVDREYSEHGDIQSSVPNPLDMREEMEMMAAKEEQLEADLETMNEIRYKKRGRRPSLTLSVTVGKRLYCIE